MRALAANCVAALAIACGAVACGAPQPQHELPSGPEGTVAWQQLRADFSELREAFSMDRPYSLNVTLELWVERLGMRTRGRGAVAVHPPHGVRMILLGPGGTTAMDLWICRDRYRFAVPAADLVRRGDADTPTDEAHGLPVDFLRWWFLEPLGGHLLAAYPDAKLDADMFVVRDRDAVVHLASQRGSKRLSVRRLSTTDEERLETTADLCGHVHYTQRSSSLDLEVTCEQVNEGTPPARAFADPDDPDQRCVEEDGS